MQEQESTFFAGTPQFRGIGSTAACFWALFALFAVLPAQATDISDVPLITSPNVQAKPNLMFVLDDSGSMAWDYMPDIMGSSGDGRTGKYGYWSSQCNGVAFNPTLTYLPPLNADGTSKPNSDFSAAWTDGFTQTGSIDLGATATQTLTSTNSPGTGSGSKTFNFSASSVDSTTFTVGNAVTLTQTVTTVTVTATTSGRNTTYTTKTDTTTNTLTGTVTSWTGSGSTWTLVANITSSTSAGPSTTTTTSSKGSASGPTTTASNWSVTPTYGTRYYYTYGGTGTETAMSWTYGSDGKVDTSTPFYQQCMSDIGSSTGSSVFQKVLIANQSAELKQNYANWYSYYRTRTLLMRTAVGRAFSALDGGYRVGFSTINSSTDATTASGFQPVGDFAGDQRSTLYTKLYGATANGGTPLRGALSKIGRYYAGYFNSTQKDPVQYACQRNFVLLSTDGYWNKGGSPGATEDNSTYGPLDLNGNLVGNQDGNEVRPMYDGSTTTITYSRVAYRVGTAGGNGCNSRQYPVRATNQTSSDNINWTPAPSAPSNNNRTCQAGSYVPPDATQTVGANAGGTVYSAAVAVTSSAGGSSDTLADVAQYYYSNDLRKISGVCQSDSSGTNQNVCGSVVPTSGRDTNPHQHMTTFAIGLGVSGTLAYSRDYLTQTAGAYADLVSGKASWPAPTTSISGSSGDARNIDDLWHAAVNGRGQYYSALNASQLADAITGVVNSITEVTGSSAAATTSTLELVAGDKNQVYSASYTTGSWTGDLQAFKLDGDTGAIGTTAVWSAQAKLTSTAQSARKIYYRQPGTGTRRAFVWDNLNADGYGDYFSGLCSNTARAVTQCTSGLNADEKTAANDGARLVNYLRGERTYESANTTLSTSRALYRARTGLLGDIINGAPRFVSKPNFSYSDAGYIDFVQNNARRKPMIYVAANDGMLHAFSADDGTNGGTNDGGTELWAYVPTAVMGNLYRLADTDYASKHRYFVDGAPVVGDVYVSGTWKTILVGGLGNGGRSYYALDITDPENPVPLWEFSDDNLGLTFGNPVITKRADGSWVVVFASGYNNYSPGDGKGRLFVLNAYTGTRSHTDVVTSAGSTDNPSGLAKINGWIEQDSDNTSTRFYGADLLGNLWRFDIDGLLAPKNSALLLAQFLLDGTTPQPVTTRPRLTKIDGKTVVVVGTGRYLGSSDISDTTTQSLYAIKDSLTDTGLGDVRNNDTLVHQTFSPGSTADTVTVSNLPVNWESNNGWWMDLPHSGERLSTDLAMQGGVLAMATSIPNGDACSSGGSSWNYFLSTGNGSALQNVAGTMISENSVIVGQSFVRMADGKLRLLRQLSSGKTSLNDTPAGSSSPITPQRTSWRELTE